MPDAPAPSFASAVDLRRESPGEYAVEVTRDWDTPNGSANGGYVLALLGRAVLLESAAPDLLVVAVSYLRPPTPGPSRVVVTLVRAGRRVSTHRAVLLQADGTAVAEAIISTHDAGAVTVNAQHTSVAPPTYPAPRDCTDLLTLVPFSFPILDRWEIRQQSLPAWMRGEPDGTTEALFWVRLRDGRPLDALAAAAAVDCYPPVTAELGLLASATVQLTVHLRSRPTTEWALAHVTTRHVGGGFHDEDVDLWGSDGTLIAQSRQLAILT